MSQRRPGQWQQAPSKASAQRQPQPRLPARCFVLRAPATPAGCGPAPAQPSRSHCPCSSWGPASCSSTTRGDAGHPPPQGNAAEDSRLLFMGPRGCLAPATTSVLAPARLPLLAWHGTASCPRAHLEEPDLAAWQKKARQTSPGSCRSKTALGFWTLLLKYSGAAKSLLAEPAAGDGCWLGSAVNPSSAQLTHALPQFITEFLSNSPSCGNGDLRQLLWAEGR